jgi:hypothetical protein
MLERGVKQVGIDIPSCPGKRSLRTNKKREFGELWRRYEGFKKKTKN